ncbi:MAG: glycosyl hydrolase family 28-related protein, partial [Sphingobacterium sp.]
MKTQNSKIKEPTQEQLSIPNQQDTSRSYSVVTTWYDGTPMDDSKLDQWGIYIKNEDTGEYLRENKPLWGEIYSEIDTIAMLRSISLYNQYLLTIGYYKGVRLSGYWEKGDLPYTIDYRIANTNVPDNGGNVIQAGTVKFVSQIASKIDVRFFGAKGDGVQNDQPYIMNAIQTKTSTIYFPTPKVNYKIQGSLQMSNNQKLIGDNLYAKEQANDIKGLQGDGINPVIIMGFNGTDDRRLLCSINNLVVKNNGTGTCVRVQHCHNFSITNSRIHQTGTGKAVDVFFSYRANISDNWIAGPYGLYAMDNVNGLTFESNTITGGTGGTAVCIGRSQGVWVQKNIIESSLKGILISSTGTVEEGGDPNDGSCSGVRVDDNYIEACGTPILIGKTYRVAGGTCIGNTMGNVAAGNPIPMSKMTGMIGLGRLDSFRVSNNYIDQKNDVSIFDFWLPTAAVSMSQCDIVNNVLPTLPTTAPLIKFMGQYGENKSIHRG